MFTDSTLRQQVNELNKYAQNNGFITFIKRHKWKEYEWTKIQTAKISYEFHHLHGNELFSLPNSNHIGLYLIGNANIAEKSHHLFHLIQAVTHEILLKSHSKWDFEVFEFITQFSLVLCDFDLFFSEKIVEIMRIERLLKKIEFNCYPAAGTNFFKLSISENAKNSLQTLQNSIQHNLKLLRILNELREKLEV
jgi:hypothetical protein